jgi:hypothetical protein
LKRTLTACGAVLLLVVDGMRLSRLAWGVIAGALAIAAAFLVAEFDVGVPFAIFGVDLAKWTFLVVGAGVLWLADRFDLMSSAWTDPVLRLEPAAPGSRPSKRVFGRRRGRDAA